MGKVKSSCLSSPVTPPKQEGEKDNEPWFVDIILNIPGINTATSIEHKVSALSTAMVGIKSVLPNIITYVVLLKT